MRDEDGNIIADEVIQHIYLIEEGLIRSMELRKPEVSPNGSLNQTDLPPSSLQLIHSA